VERNLMDAMGVARNVVLEPKLLPGGGACEMAVSRALTVKADTIEGVEQWPYRAVAQGLEVIPRTLAQNCGANVIRTMTKLRAAHAESSEPSTFGTCRLPFPFHPLCSSNAAYLACTLA
jgi:T-complex protein 1 subunit gamma